MRIATVGLALLVPLCAAPDTGLAQQTLQAGSRGRGPEGNLQSGAAMGGAQGQSSGMPNGRFIPRPAGSRADRSKAR